MIVGLSALSIMTVGMGLSPYFVLYLIMMFLYSIALTMVQTSTTTMIQENANSPMQGRVFGLMGAMYSGFLPVGMAVFGPLADTFPLQWIMVGTGIVLAAVAIYLTMGRALFREKATVNSTTTHVVNYKNCIIVIKNVPCLECDQCGEK